MKFITKYKSPNYNTRKKGIKIKYIIIHYTAMKTHIEALEYMCDRANKVSSHLLIDKLGIIYKLVDIKHRAWHAGYSYWKKDIDINSKSIGIELDNYTNNSSYKNYPDDQIISLKNLLNFLMKKYDIKGHNILGHSDIAPYRKIDPGPKFPWHKLKDLNIYALPKSISKAEFIILESIFNKKLLKTIDQKSLFMLSEIGFDVSKAKKSNKNFVLLIKSFQSHYRQKLINGKIDKETLKILYKKFNESLTI